MDIFLKVSLVTIMCRFLGLYELGGMEAVLDAWVLGDSEETGAVFGGSGMRKEA